MFRINDEMISALERSPAMQAVQNQVYEERCNYRRELLQRITAVTATHQKAEAALMTKAAPVEKRLATLRAEVAKLESELEPLAAERVSLASKLDTELSQIRAGLRKDAAIDCEDFLRTLDVTHREVANNARGQRMAILHTTMSATATQSQIASALALLLDAYRETGQAAITEVNLVAALDRIRTRLAAADVRLLD